MTGTQLSTQDHYHLRYTMTHILIAIDDTDSIDDGSTGQLVQHIVQETENKNWLTERARS